MNTYDLYELLASPRKPLNLKRLRFKVRYKGEDGHFLIVKGCTGYSVQRDKFDNALSEVHAQDGDLLRERSVGCAFCLRDVAAIKTSSKWRKVRQPTKAEAAQHRLQRKIEYLQTQLINIGCAIEGLGLEIQEVLKGV